MSDAPVSPPLLRLCAEVVVLRERSDRQHKLFEQALTQARDDLIARFGQFAGDAQHAYQQLRTELTGEKRASLALFNHLLELALDLERVAAAKPPFDGASPALAGWAEGVEVLARRARAVLAGQGVHRYDAEVGSAYQPALHERVGGQRVAGLEALRVAEQVEPGYASQQPDFVLRRAKVLVSE